MSKSEKILLSLVLVVSFFLRFYQLNFQSLWVDELHTMIEADPSLSFSELFNYLRCCDQHPPIFFFIVRLAFILFGYSEFVARSISALSGTISVWVLFLLGKELYNKKLGIIAALLTCVNYFNILYSQEARGYIVLFLFTSLSFLYFLKLQKNISVKNTVVYCLFTLLMMYTHYYGIFVFVSQTSIALFYWLYISDNKPKFLKIYSISAIVIGLVYALWLPFIFEMSNIKSFWITTIPTNFAEAYFFDYFGNTELLKPFLLLFLIIYCVFLIGDKREIKNSPIIFGFIVFSLWIFITYLIPYLRSILMVPMLSPRYTIVVLPAIILMLSFGITLIPNNHVKNGLLIMFVLTSLIDLVFVKKYYSQISKTQFRELTSYIANHRSNKYPIVNPNTTWHFQYYAKKHGIEKYILGEDTDQLLDSLAQIKNGIGFWIVGTHNTPKITDDRVKLLSINYSLSETKDFYDAWVQLYLPLARESKEITFDKSLYFKIDKDTLLALWNGKINAHPISLKKGKYNITIISRGTPASGEQPRVKVTINGNIIGEYAAFENMSQTNFLYESHEGIANLSLEMMNDFSDKNSKQDRNVFITKILVSEIK